MSKRAEFESVEEVHATRDRAQEPDCSSSKCFQSSRVGSRPQAWHFCGRNASSHSIGWAYRSLQLREAFSSVLDINEAPLDTERFCRQRLRNYFKGLSTGLRNLSRWVSAPRNIGRTGLNFRSIDELYGLPQAPRICLWESTALQSQGKRLRKHADLLIACPQNMESLITPGGVSDLMKPNDLANEIDSLRMADLVVTISWEEQWLLQNHGINAVWLPYFPPDRLRRRLDSIRSQRKPLPEDGPILLFGSALYPPTAVGLRVVLKEMGKLEDKYKRRCVLFGNGTESLKDDAEAAGIRCLGRVDDRTYDKLLRHASAAVIWQVLGAGALTRIPELLLAGVPIIANRLAARSTSLYEGIRICDDTSELAQALCQKPALVPEPSFSVDRPPYRTAIRAVRSLVRFHVEQ